MLVFRQLFDPTSSTYTYLLGCSATKEALLIDPVFEQARNAPKRVIFSAGEDDRVLRAVQIILDEGIAQPILIGRPDIIRHRAERLGLRFRPGTDVALIDPSSDPRYDRYWSAYHELMERRGVTPDTARAVLRTNSTAIGAIAVHRKDAESLICGTLPEKAFISSGRK